MSETRGVSLLLAFWIFLFVGMAVIAVMAYARGNVGFVGAIFAGGMCLRNAIDERNELKRKHKRD